MDYTPITKLSHSKFSVLLLIQNVLNCNLSTIFLYTKQHKLNYIKQFLEIEVMLKEERGSVEVIQYTL